MQSQALYQAVLIVCAATFALGAHAKDVDAAIDKGVIRANKAEVAQEKIDNIDVSRRSIEAQYKSVEKENEGLTVYVNQLKKQIASQEEELKNIAQSIRQVTLIERQITPLMLKMIDSLDSFVKADLPFQKQERLKRIENLNELMGRSDVTVAEKYRKVLDAYQKEMNYGQTIKSYRGNLELGGEEKAVDFLRVGRIALLYQTLDGKNLGAWDNKTQSYQSLDASYKSKLDQALRIAREQAAPDLIKVPVSAPVKAKGEVK